ncbi:hypothetical protein [Halapricum salinum]|uniref:Uncharacterized protein n=1 Tax=Halapricum salinum TaxID=1457250 RepID=A0A4D6HIW2_9EURY|nr:hypothetical protein [Halapricum salinum]QCC52647.1 hypothetical protein DV733_16035 [Halapricum salinum]
MNLNDLSRRRFLATGSFGAVVATTGAYLTIDSGEVDHNQQFLVQQSDVELLVNWAEWYNDTKLEDQASPVDVNGPLVDLRNVLPGDSGRLHFGLALGEQSTLDAAQLSMQLVAPVSSYDENGITEPEQMAGDTSVDQGELQNLIQLRVWYDVGIMIGDTEFAGRCDGDFDPGETLVAAGSLADVADVLSTWTPLDATPGVDGDSCVGQDEQLCIGIEWSFDPGTTDPVLAQTDSVDFQIGFRAESCSN